MPRGEHAAVSGQTFSGRRANEPPTGLSCGGGALPPMAHYPRWGMCWSSPNLQNFLTWFHEYASVEEQTAVLQLSIVNHREALPALLTMLGCTPKLLPVSVRYKGSSVPLLATACTERHCHRCMTGGGGYQWRWLDQRWTPQAARDLNLTPEQLQQEIVKPWPVGMLRQHAALPASTSSADTAMVTLDT